jgi:hypothetical protein
MKRIFLTFAAFAAFACSTAVGQSRGFTDVKFVSVSPTVDTSIYAAKDNIGGLLTFSASVCGPIKHGYVTGVMITDKSDNAVEYDLLLFKSSPSGTFTDQAATDPSDADLSLMLPVINIASTDHFSLNDNGISSLSSLRSQVWAVPTSSSSSPGTLYGALVSRGTPTYTSTGDITVTLAIACD